MKTNRRRFIREAGLAGIAAASAGTLSGQAMAAKSTHPDPAVRKVNGPFGEGMPITVAGYDYNRVAALADGRVTIEDCRMTYEVTSIGPMNMHALASPKTRHVTEIGLIPYLLAWANDGIRDYALLPVPVLRVFRHKSMWVRTDSGIDNPSQLRGKRVATAGYSSSGLTHIRGVLQDEYGVKPEDIDWINTSMGSRANLGGKASNWELVEPEGVKITPAPEGMDESDLLLAGEVDAIFHAAEPQAFMERNPAIRRLFVDHRSVERDYYQRTGIFPIMHSIALRRDVMQQNPWLEVHAAPGVGLRLTALVRTGIRRNRGRHGPELLPLRLRGERRNLRHCFSVPARTGADEVPTEPGGNLRTFATRTGRTVKPITTLWKARKYRSSSLANNERHPEHPTVVIPDLIRDPVTLAESSLDSGLRRNDGWVSRHPGQTTQRHPGLDPGSSNDYTALNGCPYLQLLQRPVLDAIKHRVQHRHHDQGQDGGKAQAEHDGHRHALEECVRQ
jgi:4,5-dihydroxyphthalate decarboxylase